MQLYTGIALHSSNSYLAIIDEKGKRMFKIKLFYNMSLHQRPFYDIVVLSGFSRTQIFSDLTLRAHYENHDR